MLYYADFELVYKPVLQKVVWVAAEPQRIFLSFFTFRGIFKNSWWADPIKPLKHFYSHNLSILNVENGLGEVGYSQLLEQFIEERIFLATIDAVDGLLRGEVEESVAISLGQHFDEV